jgi:hypothetical protein
MPTDRRISNEVIDELLASASTEKEIAGPGEIIGLDVGATETEAFWREFPRSLPAVWRASSCDLRRSPRA